MEASIVEVIAESHYQMLHLISCRFSTCLQQWQGKEVGYSLNCLTCALHWIWPKWPKAGFRTPPYRKPNIWSRNLGPKSEKRRRGVLCFVGIKWWRLRWKDTWLWFVRTTKMALFLARIAQQGIPRHAGGAKVRVLLNQPDWDIGHQIRRHLRPERHLRHLVPLRAPKDFKTTICQPQMRIHVFPFPSLNLSILMQ